VSTYARRDHGNIGDMPKELSFFPEQAPLSIQALLISLAIGVVYAVIIRWHFKRFGSTLSNREDFARVFPFVLLTTILIITVVKSSLALSLGLIGALSIVRFRTPVKEPEELAYLFLSIAIGLGLGANQFLATSIAAAFILAVMAGLQSVSNTAAGKNLYLSVQLPSDPNQVPDQALKGCNEIISTHTNLMDLRRFDVAESGLTATYFVDFESDAKLPDLTAALKNSYPEIAITFIDQNQMPSI
jgi:hypothetical protein